MPDPMPTIDRRRRQLVQSLSVLALSAAVPAPAQTASFANELQVPAWFRISFLDLREDARDAAKAGKNLMLFFDQEGCPWCKRLLEVDLAQPELAEYTRSHFDAIELNVRGSREVTWFDGKARTEKDLAAFLKVRYTPTLLFLDARGNVVLRANGYYPPPRLRAALDYVASGAYRQEPDFARYLQQRGIAADEKGTAIKPAQ
jgi:thioredoxin-related protein